MSIHSAALFACAIGLLIAPAFFCIAIDHIIVLVWRVTLACASLHIFQDCGFLHYFQQNCFGPYKTMQQAYVSAAYCHKRSAKRREIASRAGKLYDDDDFSTCKFDAYCVGDILPWDKTITHIFRAWCEDWEKTRFNSSGCQLFEAWFSIRCGQRCVDRLDYG